MMLKIWYCTCAEHSFHQQSYSVAVYTEELCRYIEHHQCLLDSATVRPQNIPDTGVDENTKHANCYRVRPLCQLDTQSIKQLFWWL